MSAEDDKKARLASALRANLARRKAQGRARAALPADGEGAAVPPAGADDMEGGAAPGSDRMVRTSGEG